MFNAQITKVLTVKKKKWKKKTTHKKPLYIKMQHYGKLPCTSSLVPHRELILESNHRYAVTGLHKTPDMLRGPGDLSYTLNPSSFIISGNRNILFSLEAHMLAHLFHSLKKYQQLCTCKKTVGKQTSIYTRERLFTHHMRGNRITGIPFHCQTVIKGIQ